MSRHVNKILAKIKMKDIGHDEAMASVFREDPAYADFYVQQLLKDGEPSEIKTTIRQLEGKNREVLCCLFQEDKR